MREVFLLLFCIPLSRNTQMLQNEAPPFIFVAFGAYSPSPVVPLLAYNTTTTCFYNTFITVHSFGMCLAQREIRNT